MILTIKKNHFILFCIFLLHCSNSNNYLNEKIVSSLEKEQALSAASHYLSYKDCQNAFDVIFPLYNSKYTNNNIRLAMTSVYSCFANIEFFSFLEKLTDASFSLNGSGFFEFLVSLFPSTLIPFNDRIQEFSEKGLDSALSVVFPEKILLPSFSLQNSSYNPQSLLADDRLQASNEKIIFLSFSLIGSILSRYGLPNASHEKTIPLPWITPDLTPQPACSLASGFLHLTDVIVYFLINNVSVLRSSFEKVEFFLNGFLNASCALGCFHCGLSCTHCPLPLKNRDSCTGEPHDLNSCAAAGIVFSINSIWTTGIP